MQKAVRHPFYDRHVKPVEHEQAGEYALVTPDGQAFFAPTPADIMIRAHEHRDARNAIFKVGSVVLGQV